MHYAFSKAEATWKNKRHSNREKYAMGPYFFREKKMQRFSRNLSILTWIQDKLASQSQACQARAQSSQVL